MSMLISSTGKLCMTLSVLYQRVHNPLVNLFFPFQPFVSRHCLQHQVMGAFQVMGGLHWAFASARQQNGHDSTAVTLLVYLSFFLLRHGKLSHPCQQLWFWFSWSLRLIYDGHMDITIYPSCLCFTLLLLVVILSFSSVCTR
jgi:hypothetical protein